MIVSFGMIHKVLHILGPHKFSPTMLSILQVAPLPRGSSLYRSIAI
jgi:hypothetical protein